MGVKATFELWLVAYLLKNNGVDRGEFLRFAEELARREELLLLPVDDGRATASRFIAHLKSYGAIVEENGKLHLVREKVSPFTLRSAEKLAMLASDILGGCRS